MSWSEIRNNESVLTGYNFVTQETVDSVQYTYTDTFDLNFELVANKWEDDASNSNTFGETVVSSTDTSAWAALEAEFTWLNFSGWASVRVQEGANSRLEDGLTVTESRKHLFDVTDWSHLGGVEAYEGAEVQYEADWVRGTESLTIGEGTPQLTSSDGAAYDLFGAAHYTEESWTNWEGLPEYERTYYDGSGNKLGSSFTSQNQWTDNYTDPNNPETITNTNSNYNDPDGNWLGWSSVEMDSSSQVRNANQSSEKVVASSDQTTWDALAGEFTWLDFSGWTTVRVQDETMSWLDGTTLVTESRKHLFDDSWNHLGGKEVTNSGAVVQYTSGWTRGEEKFQIASDTPQLDSGNTDHAGAISLFGNAFYYEESYTNWQGQQETETNYYSSTGVKLGSSFKFIDTWMDNSDPANPVTVTNTNINYNGPDWEWLGNEWYDTAGNGGQNFERVVEKLDAQGVTTAEWTALVSDTDLAHITLASNLTSVRVQEGTNTWVDVTTSTSTTESRKHLFDVNNWDHLGGFESYDGGERVVQYEADWQRGAESITIGGDTPQLTSADGAAYDLFGAAYYTEESWTNWEGLPEYERTYYDGSGNKLGSSFTSQNQWTDNYTDPNNPETITNTNSNYNDPDGNWLGWSSVEMDSSSQVRNANQSSEKVVASSDQTTWDALAGEFTWLDFSGWTTVRVQDETMSWLDGTTLVTESRKHLFDDSWNHLGGKEVTNSGAVVQYTSGWTRGEEKFQIASDTPQLDSGNTDHAGAISLFGNAFYYEESYTNWQGQQETETNYYSSTGVKLGSSFKFIDTWMDNSDPANPVTVTNTNINYNGPDWEWLGNEWYDTAGNGGQNFERVVEKLDAQGVTTAEWTALVSDTDLAHITLASNLTSVRVQEGTNTWVDVTTSTSTTESRKHLFDVINWDHLGGFESYDGGERVVQYEADWQRGAESITIGGDTPQLTSSDGAAYDLFGAAYYTEESWTNWEGLPEYERTYYDGSGNKLGSSFTSQNQWTDNYTDPNNPETITNTNSNYNDPDGNWLGWSSVEMDSSSQVRNANQSSEKVVASSDQTTWDALAGEFTWLDFSGWTTVRVQDETMSWLDGTTLVTESRKHLFDDSWNHLGGKEVTNSGAVVQYTSGWTRGEEKFQIASDTPQLDSGNTDHAGAISLFGNAFYYEESYTNWQGQQETETNYYSSTGVKLGSSFKFIDTWMDNSDPANPVTVTNTNINYNGPDWEWLGNEWYDTAGNGGQNFERVVEKLDAQGVTTAEWTALVSDTDLAHITLASNLTSVRVQEGTNTWVDVTTSTSTTESRKHLFDVNNWDHLGGFESYDGGERVVQYEADWQRGAESITIGGDTPQLTSADGAAYDLFGAAHYTEESWTNWEGLPEYERTYYDGSGNKLGSSFTSQNQWTDDHTDPNNPETITNTNSNYNDPDGNWLGWSSVEMDSSSQVRNANQSSEKVVASSDQTTWDALAGEFTWLDFSGWTTVRVQDETMSWLDGTTLVTESRKHLFDDSLNHLGGKEVTNSGAVVQYTSGWSRGEEKFQIASDTPQLDSGNTDHAGAISLFGNAFYYEESYTNWQGQQETETNYYSSTGVKLGSSFKFIDTWMDNSDPANPVTVTNTNINYNNAGDRWLGNESSDTLGNVNQNFERVVQKFEVDGTTLTGGWIALFGDPNDVNQNGDPDLTHITLASNLASVRVQEGTNTWVDVTTSTSATESRKHLFDSNREHVGGFESYDSGARTILFDANWQRGAETFQIVTGESNSEDNTPQLTEADGAAYDLFGAAYFSEETWLNGEQKIEVARTYYEGNGNKIGSSFMATEEDRGAEKYQYNFQDEGGSNLGWAWENSNGESFTQIEKTIVKSNGVGGESANWVALESKFTWLDLSSFDSVLLEVTKETFSVDINGTTTLESQERQHVFSAPNIADGASAVSLSGNAKTEVDSIDFASTGFALVANPSDDVMPGFENVVTLADGDVTGLSSGTYAIFEVVAQSDPSLVLSYEAYPVTFIVTQGRQDTSHFGGWELRDDGTEVQWDANFERGVETFSVITSGADKTLQLTSADGSAFTLFGDAYVKEDSFVNWRGETETQTDYFSEHGLKLGSATTTQQTNENSVVTYEETKYNNADGNWLGLVWSDVEGNSSENFETVVSNTDTAAWQALQIEFDWVSFSGLSAVRVERGSSTFDNGGQPYTETRKHLWVPEGSGTSAHLGGQTVERDGTEVEWNAGWARGAETFTIVTNSIDPADNTPQLMSTDGAAFDVFGLAYFKQDSWLDWEQNSVVEQTFYNSSGIKLGKAFTTTKVENGVNREDFNFQNAEDNEIGQGWSQADGQEYQRLNSIVTKSDGNSGTTSEWQALEAEFSWLTFSGIDSVLVQDRSDTFLSGPGATQTLVTETQKHLYVSPLIASDATAVTLDTASKISEVAGLDFAGSGEGSAVHPTNYTHPPQDNVITVGADDVTGLSAGTYAFFETYDQSGSLNGYEVYTVAFGASEFTTHNTHFGGSESGSDGTVVQYNAGFMRGAETFSIVTAGPNATPQLLDTDGAAYDLFGAAYYAEESWLNPQNEQQIDQGYYNANGTKLGEGFFQTTISSGVVREEFDFRDADGMSLGWGWSEADGQQSQQLKSIVTKSNGNSGTTSEWQALEAEFSWLTFSGIDSVLVEDRSDTFLSGPGATQTLVTETQKHLYVSPSIASDATAVTLDTSSQISEVAGLDFAGGGEGSAGHPTNYTHPPQDNVITVGTNDVTGLSAGTYAFFETYDQSGSLNGYEVYTVAFGASEFTTPDSHFGGKDVADNGLTVQFGAERSRGDETLTIILSGTDATDRLDASDGISHQLYGEAYVIIDDVYQNNNGNTETLRKYFDAAGNKVGKSYSKDTTPSRTDVNYENSAGVWIGEEWADTDGTGYADYYTTVIKSNGIGGTTAAWEALAAEFSWVDLSGVDSVMVGQERDEYLDSGSLVVETQKHLYVSPLIASDATAVTLDTSSQKSEVAGLDFAGDGEGSAGHPTNYTLPPQDNVITVGDGDVTGLSAGTYAFFETHDQSGSLNGYEVYTVTFGASDTTIFIPNSTSWMENHFGGKFVEGDGTVVQFNAGLQPATTDIGDNVLAFGASPVGAFAPNSVYAILPSGDGSTYNAVAGQWDDVNSEFTPQVFGEIFGLTIAALQEAYFSGSVQALGSYTPPQPNVVRGTDVEGLSAGVTYAIVETATDVFEAIAGIWNVGNTTFTPGDGSGDVQGLTDVNVAAIYADTNTEDLGMYTPAPTTTQPNVVRGTDVEGLSAGVTYAIVETATDVFEAIAGIWNVGNTTFTPGDGSGDVQGLTDVNVAAIYADTNTEDLGMYTPAPTTTQPNVVRGTDVEGLSAGVTYAIVETATDVFEAIAGIWNVGNTTFTPGDGSGDVQGLTDVNVAAIYADTNTEDLGMYTPAPTTTQPNVVRGTDVEGLSAGVTYAIVETATDVFEAIAGIWNVGNTTFTPGDGSGDVQGLTDVNVAAIYADTNTEDLGMYTPAPTTTQPNVVRGTDVEGLSAGVTYAIVETATDVFEAIAGIWNVGNTTFTPGDGSGDVQGLTDVNVAAIYADTNTEDLGMYTPAPTTTQPNVVRGTDVEGLSAGVTYAIVETATDVFEAIAGIWNVGNTTFTPGDGSGDVQGLTDVNVAAIYADTNTEDLGMYTPAPTTTQPNVVRGTDVEGLSAGVTYAIVETATDVFEAIAGIWNVGNTTFTPGDGSGDVQGLTDVNVAAIYADTNTEDLGMYTPAPTTTQPNVVRGTDVEGLSAGVTYAIVETATDVFEAIAGIWNVGNTTFTPGDGSGDVQGLTDVNVAAIYADTNTEDLGMYTPAPTTTQPNVVRGTDVEGLSAGVTYAIVETATDVFEAIAGIWNVGNTTFTPGDGSGDVQGLTDVNVAAIYADTNTEDLGMYTPAPTTTQPNVVRGTDVEGLSAGVTYAIVETATDVFEAIAGIWNVGNTTFTPGDGSGDVQGLTDVNVAAIYADTNTEDLGMYTPAPTTTQPNVVRGTDVEGLSAGVTYAIVETATDVFEAIAGIWNVGNTTFTPGDGSGDVQGLTDVNVAAIYADTNTEDLGMYTPAPTTTQPNVVRGTDVEGLSAGVTYAIVETATDVFEAIAGIWNVGNTTFTPGDGSGDVQGLTDVNVAAIYADTNTEDLGMYTPAPTTTQPNVVRGTDVEGLSAGVTYAIVETATDVFEAIAGIWNVGNTTFTPGDGSGDVQGLTDVNVAAIYADTNTEDLGMYTPAPTTTQPNVVRGTDVEGLSAGVTYAIVETATDVFEAIAGIWNVGNTTFTPGDGSGDVQGLTDVNVAAIYADTNTEDLGMYTPAPTTTQPNVVRGTDVEGLSAGVTYAIVETATDVFEAIAGIWNVGNTTFTPGDGSGDVQGLTDVNVAAIYADTNTEDLGMYTPAPTTTQPNVVRGTDVEGLSAGVTYAIVETATDVFEAIAGIWNVGNTTFTPGDGSGDVQGLTDVNVAAIYADTNTEDLGMYTPAPTTTQPNVVRGTDVEGLSAGVTYAIVETATDVFEAIAGIWNVGNTTFTPGDGSGDVQGLTDVNVAAIYADTNTEDLGMYTPAPTTTQPNVDIKINNLAVGSEYILEITGNKISSFDQTLGVHIDFVYDGDANYFDFINIDQNTGSLTIQNGENSTLSITASQFETFLASNSHNIASKITSVEARYDDEGEYDSFHHTNGVIVNGDLDVVGQASAPDHLTILFDDTTDLVTISGLDADVTHGELVFKVVDDSAGAQATTEATTEATIVLAHNQVAIAGDVATIAYTDLKAAIESASNTAGHDELSVSYVNNAGSIANDGLGIGDITADVFII